MDNECIDESGLLNPEDNKDEAIVEIEEDNANLNKLNDTIADLQHIYDELKTAGLVNKTIACAVESISPDFIDSRFPVNSYTTELSKTNYNTTLEGIVSGIAKTVGFVLSLTIKIVKSIMDFFIKVVNFFTKRATQNKTLNENIVIKVKEINKLRSSINSKDRHIFQNAFDAISKDFHYEVSNDFTDLTANVLLDTGNISKCLYDTGKSVNGYIDAINSKLNILDSVIRSADKLDLTSATSKLANIDLMIKNGSADSTLREILHQKYTGVISEDFASFKEVIHQLDSSRSIKNVSYNSLFIRLLNGKTNLEGMYIEKPDITKSNIEKIKNKLSQLENNVQSISADMEVAMKIKESLLVIKSEVEALGNFIIVCERVSEVNGQTTLYIYNTVNKHYKTLLVELKNNGSMDSVLAAKNSYSST